MPSSPSACRPWQRPCQRTASQHDAMRRYALCDARGLFVLFFLEVEVEVDLMIHANY